MKIWKYIFHFKYFILFLSFVNIVQTISNRLEHPLNHKIQPRGGTHIFDRTGMYRPNGSLFYQEILKHGSRFLPKKSLYMGQLFWLSPKLRDIRDFHHAKTLKIAEFLKNRPIFEGKSLKMGTLFGQNHPKDGFWGSSGTPLSNSNLSSPPRFNPGTDFITEGNLLLKNKYLVITPCCNLQAAHPF